MFEYASEGRANAPCCPFSGTYATAGHERRLLRKGLKTCTVRVHLRELLGSSLPGVWCEKLIRIRGLTCVWELYIIIRETGIAVPEKLGFNYLTAPPHTYSCSLGGGWGELGVLSSAWETCPGEFPRRTISHGPPPDPDPSAPLIFRSNKIPRGRLNESAKVWKTCSFRTVKRTCSRKIPYHQRPLAFIRANVYP